MINWQDWENPLAGGAEIHLHEIFGRLAGRGHDVTALVSGFAGGAARTALDGITVHRTGGRHRFLLAAAPYYRRHFRSSGFDVVIEDLNKVPVFAPLWAGLPVVLLVHHLFGTTAFREAGLPVATATWLLEKPLPYFYRRLPVVAVSRSTVEDLVARGFDRSRTTVIPNGIDLDTFHPDPARPEFDEPTVLYLGRLRRYKRVDLILRAFQRMVADGVRARLIIAGKGADAASIADLRDRLGLSAYVDMPGFVDDAEKLRLLRGAWVNVQTSPKEGWGISNLEAAACGTPTVASDSPGLRDSVLHEETGLLVPHGDVSALAAALRRLLEDHASRHRLGEGARRFALGFAWAASADA
ncbi:MAG: glycosyltransferase family 4 protein, partial [Gemmatimonadetes bacterium]|nr:glycosyltransferase family 4 protein [Gemmatimonadota bacterium]